MKGIILAGGRGTRLYPLTIANCKQLLPIYDKPMVYYPLAVLMYAGIQEILIISTPEDLPRFEKIFGDGSHLGLDLSYQAQPEPEGIAQAFILGEKFIGEDSVALVLGDNIFYGDQLPSILKRCKDLEEGAIIFGYEVKDPERYGVIEFDEEGQPKNIVEKPKNPTSPYAVTGLYFYDNNVVSIAKSLIPSPRGELEITDVNADYLKRSALRVHLLERGFAWLDTGTHEALQQASLYVQTIQERQGIQIACLEEIAYQMGFITHEELHLLAKKMGKSEYGLYLTKIASRLPLPLATR
ncbi:MAG: glucose-1-phosphate thymidylyltransferase RfbA [Rhabdochlamydiaceae bacterium]|jgi:glucose-1-phosphate thymidylyltransferase